MARGSLRRYDVQATYSVLASVLSVAPLAGAIFLLLRNWESDLGAIVHGSQGSFLPALVVCVGLAGVGGAVGLVLGINSAGQRRNDKQRLSWTGFFVGSAVVTGTIIVAIAFVMLRFRI